MLIILIKVVPLFVWMFPVRNTDFPHCFISGQKLEGWQRPSLYSARTYVLWVLKYNSICNVKMQSLKAIFLFFRLIPYGFWGMQHMLAFSSIPDLSCAHRCLYWELLCASVYLQFQERKWDDCFSSLSWLYVGCPVFRTLVCVFT